MTAWWKKVCTRELRTGKSLIFQRLCRRDQANSWSTRHNHECHECWYISCICKQLSIYTYGHSKLEQTSGLFCVRYGGNSNNLLPFRSGQELASPRPCAHKHMDMLNHLRLNWTLPKLSPNLDIVRYLITRNCMNICSKRDIKNEKKCLGCVRLLSVRNADLSP